MTRNQQTILVADDEPHLTYMLARKLQDVGFEVLTVDNGGAALAMASLHHPALIITDYQMPGISGLEMCLQLRQQPATAHIPAIMLTARGHRLADDDLARAGIRAILMKPFSLKEIVEQVRAVLGPVAAEPEDMTPTGAGAP